MQLQPRKIQLNPITSVQEYKRTNKSQEEPRKKRPGETVREKVVNFRTRVVRKDEH